MEAMHLVWEPLLNPFEVRIALFLVKVSRKSVPIPSRIHSPL